MKLYEILEKVILRFKGGGKIKLKPFNKLVVNDDFDVDITINWNGLKDVLPANGDKPIHINNFIKNFDIILNRMANIEDKYNWGFPEQLSQHLWFTTTDHNGTIESWIERNPALNGNGLYRINLYRRGESDRACYIVQPTDSIVHKDKVYAKVF